MNGRVYDPVLGRFLSPDKYVQEGGNSQNYNSYSYCLNNPRKYADPSGNVFVLDDFIAITAMGAMMGAMNATMSDKPHMERGTHRRSNAVTKTKGLANSKPEQGRERLIPFSPCSELYS